MKTNQNNYSMAKPFGGGLIVALALVGLFIAPNPLRAAPLPGAIFSTDSTCSGVNLNIYSSKDDVYLDGGPAHPGAASLPDGSYYVQVTNPSGSLVLGSSVGSGNQTPFVVLGGEPQGCYQLSAILNSASSGYTTPGYDDTDNPGGEYKVWVSTDSTFVNNSTKTDNFKVREDAGDTADRHGAMTWVTLSNGTCPPFFPLEEGIFVWRVPLIPEGKRGSRQSKNAGSTSANCAASPREKCYPCHGPVPSLRQEVLRRKRQWDMGHHRS
ncbi:MAG: hypothetical protein ABIU29_08920 [Chthoniobacterales bacterium]